MIIATGIIFVVVLVVISGSRVSLVVGLIEKSDIGSVDRLIDNTIAIGLKRVRIVLLQLVGLRAWNLR